MKSHFNIFHKSQIMKSPIHSNLKQKPYYIPTKILISQWTNPSLNSNLLRKSKIKNSLEFKWSALTPQWKAIFYQQLAHSTPKHRHHTSKITQLIKRLIWLDLLISTVLCKIQWCSINKCPFHSRMMKKWQIKCYK